MVMSEYVRIFQGIEIQISADAMTVGDRKHKLFVTLPVELAMQIYQQNQSDMAARQWDSLHKVARADSHPPGPHRSLSQTQSIATPTPTNPTTLPYTMPTAAPTSPGEPMDLDVMHQSRDPRPTPPGTRCYNCNGLGHFSRDCNKTHRRPIAGSARVAARDVSHPHASLEEGGTVANSENPVEMEE